jgi:magnesium transporter
MITIFHKSIKEKKVKRLTSFKTGSWVYVEKPTDEELERIATDFNLDMSIITDAIDPYEVPRVEEENDIVYIFTRVPYLKDIEHSSVQTLTIPLLIIIGENFVITISKKELPNLDRLTNRKPDLYTTQKTKLLLHILWAITDSYNQFLINLNKQMRRVGVDLEKIRNKDIVQFVLFERMLNDFLAALIPTNTLLKNILYGKFLTLYKNDKDLIEDLFLNNEQLIELCRSNLKNIVNIRESYSTIMTNNLNRVIKLLTTLTILLTVPTIISSVYGMNIQLPFADSPHAFTYIVALTVVISSSLLLFFSKKDWL